AFPKNANISIIISLSGIGIDKTSVQIIADPKVDKNIHQLEARGDFGKLELELENNPSPDNPKTSYLTAMSILSSLKSLDSVITIGSLMGIPPYIMSCTIFYHISINHCTYSMIVK